MNVYCSLCAARGLDHCDCEPTPPDTGDALKVSDEAVAWANAIRQANLLRAHADATHHPDMRDTFEAGAAALEAVADRTPSPSLDEVEAQTIAALTDYLDLLTELHRGHTASEVSRLLTRIKER